VVEVLLYGAFGLVAAAGSGTVAYLWGWDRGYELGLRDGARAATL
jgi:hypothetical protein